MNGEQMSPEEWHRRMVLGVLIRARKRAAHARERRQLPKPYNHYDEFDYASQAHYDPHANPAAYFAFHDADAATGDAADLADHIARHRTPEGTI